MIYEMSLTFNIACNSGTQISAVTLRIVREHIVLYYIYIYIYRTVYFLFRFSSVDTSFPYMWKKDHAVKKSSSCMFIKLNQIKYY